MKKDNPYAHNNLVANEDMNVVKISDNVPRTAEGKVDRNSIKTAGMQNAFDVGRKVNDHLAIVKNRYSGSDIAISWGKIGHSLDRRGPVSSIIPKLGELVQNGIRVNEMSRDGTDSYAMVAIAENEFGEKYAVTMVINKGYENPELVGYDVSNVLGSASAKKESVASYGRPNSHHNGVALTDSKISIADVIGVVKEFNPNILSDDVLSIYDLTKDPTSKYTGVKYSVSNAEGNVKGDNERQFGKTQKKFFDAFGVEVVMDESLDANAEVLLDDGVVKVSPYADIDDWKIAGHEFTHLLKVLAPEEYELYARLAREEIGDRWDTYYEEAKRDYTAYYEKKGKEVTDDLIEEEVLARYAEGLDNNDFIRKVARENTSIAVKIRNILKRIVDKIKAVFSSGERAGTPENIKKIITAKDAWESAAIEAAQNKGKGVSGEDGKSYSLKRVYNKNGIIDVTFTQKQLDQNAALIWNMDSVCDISLNEFEFKDNTELEETVLKMFSDLGGEVYSQTLGRVELSRSGYKADINHGLTKAKIRAFASIPNIIKYGKPIFIDNKGSDRVVIAAPITIGGVKHFCGVMLKRGQGHQGFYIHDVITEKEASSPNTGGHPATGKMQHTGSERNLFFSSILHRSLCVNRNTRQSDPYSDKWRPDLFSQEMKFLRGLESENAHLKLVQILMRPTMDKVKLILYLNYIYL